MEPIKTKSVWKSGLVLTVGTGKRDDLQKSLIDPLMKSINDGDWDRVVLLPSQETAPNAEQILSEMDTDHIISRPLEKSGMETNADECFGHFDQILEELINQGFNRTEITLDFTRGTKAMSAALLMAGMSREIPNIRYVSGSERDDRGMVIPGTEVIKEANTRLVDARRLLNQTERLMQRGNFEAVCNLIQNRNPIEESTGYFYEMQKDLWEICESALVYSAWDRFDYEGAFELLKNGEKSFRNGRYGPTQEMNDWLKYLANEIDRGNTNTSAIYVQRLACDVLANAERRIRDGLYEDAYVRCYRVLELIGQYCLFQRGYDSGMLSEHDEKVQELVRYLEKKKSAPLGKVRIKKKSFATAGQYQVTRLLDIRGDCRGNALNALGNKRDRFLTSNRNKSLLIHGFSSANTEQIKNIEISVKDLEEFLCNDFDKARDYLKVARSINFSIE